MALGRHLFARIDAIRGRYPLFRADSSLGAAALMEDQAIHVVGEIGERQFGLGAGQPDRADEEAECADALRANPRLAVVCEPRPMKAARSPFDLARV